MRICIPAEGDEVSQHFGHTPEFVIFTVEDGKVVSKEVLRSPGHEPGLIPRLMGENGVDVVITGGLGRRAQGMFDEMGIRVISGVSGSIEDAIRGFLDGTLVAGENLCDH
jgi:predicted Fe-Mo cluster-binding NifX family protein